MTGRASGRGEAVYRSDVTEWSRCVAEMLKLARALPDGLERLRGFTASGRDFCDHVERIDDGTVVIASVPTARTRAFLADLRAAVANAGRAA